jgi:hypothetical protein
MCRNLTNDKVVGSADFCGGSIDLLKSRILTREEINILLSRDSYFLLAENTISDLL